MDDLVQFLQARLDEDAAVAASGESWTAFEETLFEESLSGGTRRVDVDHSIERVVACTRSWRALHIARHDPARVLREIDAKRRLLYQFEHRGNSVRAAVVPSSGGVWDDMLRLLALPYADDDDYRPEWRP